ncbi:hypothetical protein [Pedococcus sp. 5OH_020]|uniref:hypothetical protein n=1 Tax=Pedococcus sp. 5OH_020 TaxID=2989814 RepID=UPI0022E9BD93|nr:hypothetical protein [Pedococcus sp. 5OH_020]
MDELLAARVKSAMWKHTWRSPALWKNALAVMSVVLVVGAVMVFHHGADRRQVLSFLLMSVPAAAAVAYAGLVALTMQRIGSHLDRQLVPGRMLAVTMGTQSLRVRDHQSAVEYAYPVITGVHQYGDIVVISRGSAMWALPVEMFDTHDLHILRARVGRAGLPTSLVG